MFGRDLFVVELVVGFVAWVPVDRGHRVVGVVHDDGVVVIVEVVISAAESHVHGAGRRGIDSRGVCLRMDEWMWVCLQ